MYDNITLIKGDTLAFGFKVEGIEERLTSAYFTVKQEATDEEHIIQAKLYDGIKYGGDNTYKVRIPPADTARLEARNYYYDLEISVNGDTFTVLHGLLKVQQDVTREG